MNSAGRVMIGTAGWSIPAASAGDFPSEGSHLERYAQRLPAVEINSSFHRSHRAATYARWAAAVPEDFRFAVKLPKTITHACRLVGADALLDGFFGEVAGLGDKLHVVLVQLPPKLAFDREVVEPFFAALRSRTGVGVACEPRNATWFTSEADQCLDGHRVARVAAHPVLVEGGEQPGGWPGLRYHRLHGAPRVYYSRYGEPFLRDLAGVLDAAGDGSCDRWCIFDNTAAGAATDDATALLAMLAGSSVAQDAPAAADQPPPSAL